MWRTTAEEPAKTHRRMHTLMYTTWIMEPGETLEPASASSLFTSIDFINPPIRLENMKPFINVVITTTKRITIEVKLRTFPPTVLYPTTDFKATLSSFV